MIRLHDNEMSADAYKARLFLAILGLKYQSIPVNTYPGHGHETPAFRALSPEGRLPVLEDVGTVLCDAHAILVHLAERHDRAGQWLPRGRPELTGEVARWLGFADQLSASAGAARQNASFFVEIDAPSCQADAHRLFRQMDEHLWFAERAGQGWLCPGAHPTVADLACFPDVCLSEEGGVSRQDYPAIRRWTDRVKRIPGFTVMPGIFPAAPAPRPGELTGAAPDGADLIARASILFNQVAPDKLDIKKD